MTFSVGNTEYENFHAVWLEALMSLQRQDYTAALKSFDEFDKNVGDWEPSDEVMASLLGVVASQAFLAAYETNRFDRALYYANRDHALARTDFKFLARSLNNKGLALLELGRLLEAQASFQEALKAVEKLNDDDRVNHLNARQLRTLIQRHLAMVSVNRFEPNESLDELASRPAVTSLDDPQHLFTGIDVGANQMGSDIVNRAAFEAQRASKRGDFASAVRITEAAVAKLRNRKNNAKMLGIALSNLGQFTLLAKKGERAIEHLRESVSLLEQTPRPNEPLARTLHILSEALLNAKAEPEALESSRQAWLEIKDVAPDTPQALQILHQLAKLRMLAKDMTRARAALEHAMKIYDANRERLADSEFGHEGVFSIYRSLVELMLIIAVHEGWPDEAMTLVEKAKARFWNDHMKRLLAANPKQENTTEEQRWKDLEEASLDSRVIKVGHQLTDPGCLLINFFTAPNFTFVITYFEGRHDARRVNLTNNELDEKVKALMRDTQSSSRRELWRTSGAELGALLFRDLEVNIDKLRQIQFLPDGPLWHLPFDYLVLPGVTPEVPRDTSIFRSVPSAQIPSARLIDKYRPESLKADQPREVLVIARSTFNSDLSPLVSVQAEAEAVKRLARGHNCRILPEQDATKKAVLAQLATADVIHVATHALADTQEARSAVVLSDGKGGDDMLWSSEIANLNLRAQMVFLSACSSALGRLSAGEGLTSVARAFMLAGCQSVIASLWPVIDREVSPFVELFYQELFAGLTPSEALQIAKQKAVMTRIPNRIAAAFQIYGGVARPMNVGSLAQILTTKQEEEWT